LARQRCVLIENIDPNEIQDIEGARQAIVLLLNLVEELMADNRALREENQRLRDEINRLKGEQGKPDIKASQPKSSPATSADYSSERERHQPKKRSKRKKTETIRIDREQVARVEPATLPGDAQFKGYEDVVVQDVVFRTDNVLFHKEKFYSSSEGKSYLASLPPGYEGEFGPGIKSLVIVLYHAVQTSEPKILELLRSVGVQMSDGKLSNLLIKGHEDFHAEKDAVYEAGLRSSPWQHLDETSTRVNGQNQHCHIMCNPLYTAYFTTEAKDRQTVIDVLRNGQARRFVLNGEAMDYLNHVQLSAAVRQRLPQLMQNQPLDEAMMQTLLNTHLPDLGPQQCRWIMDATAIAAYHAEVVFPVVDVLVCDDAPQFKGVTENLALCWVHEGRHYKKLTPYVAHHRQVLHEFLGAFWDYYDQLLTYQQAPTPEERERLATQFDELFSTKTGYQALDDRIAKTKAKKDYLLMVLEHPEIPLHNNPVELEARRRVRKRDISFGPRTDAGKRAWDTFQTLAATTHKLGVSFFDYIHDRVSKANQIPGLDFLIAEQAKSLNLGASWVTS
jgi:hypothetical protein